MARHDDLQRRIRELRQELIAAHQEVGVLTQAQDADNEDRLDHLRRLCTIREREITDLEKQLAQGT
jgi:hypothetical protein